MLQVEKTLLLCFCFFLIFDFYFVLFCFFIIITIIIIEMSQPKTYITIALSLLTIRAGKNNIV